MIRRLLSCQKGNSLIEMGFAAPILTTLIIGTIDLSSAYSAELALEQAAHRTIERVQRDSYVITDNVVLRNEAQTAAGSGSSATINSWLECNGNGVRLDFTTGTCTPGQPYARYVEVLLQRPFTPIFGRFFPGAGDNGAVTLDASAGLRVQ